MDFLEIRKSNSSCNSSLFNYVSLDNIGGHLRFQMNNKKEIAILETTLLLITGTKEADILLKYDLAPHLEKAKEIITLLK